MCFLHYPKMLARSYYYTRNGPVRGRENFSGFSASVGKTRFSTGARLRRRWGP
jgi:hypothetical protein